MPRFVLLAHDHPFPHWDLMLENGPSLRTWRLLAIPEPSKTVQGEPLGDHRLAYLDYEGPVSGGRGHVQRIDAGSFDWLKDSANHVEVKLDGQRLQGIIELKEAHPNWTCTLS